MRGCDVLFVMWYVAVGFDEGMFESEEEYKRYCSGGLGLLILALSRTSRPPYPGIQSSHTPRNCTVL